VETQKRSKPVSNRQLCDLRHDTILIKLAAGQSIASVARELDVSASHIRDWLRSDEGLSRIGDAIDDAKEILERRLPDMVNKALDVLEATLNAPFMSAAKMTAAVTIVKTVAKLSEQQKCSKCDDSRIVN